MFIHIVHKTEEDKICAAQACLTNETVLKIPFVFWLNIRYITMDKLGVKEYENLLGVSRYCISPLNVRTTS